MGIPDGHSDGYWGYEAQPGSRAYIDHTLVYKAGKSFRVGDEFVVHPFRVHLIAAAFTDLKVNSPTELVPKSSPRNGWWEQQRSFS